METNRLFVYGILKRDFELDLSKQGCKFLGEAQLSSANLYGIGHRDVDETWSGVGLRFIGDPQRVVFGEVFEIPRQNLWDWLDSIEQNGFCYTRKIVPIEEMWIEQKCEQDSSYAWVYEHTYPGYYYEANNLIANGRFQ